MKSRFITPTAEEEAQINKGIAQDPDTYELTDEEFKQLRPFRGRPPSATPIKQMTTIRLSPEVMSAFKATGAGWQTRIDGAIKEEAAVVLAATGLTVSDAVRMLLTRVAQDKALPFELMIPNVTTIQAMKDARAGKVTKAANLTALFDDLNADT